MVGFIVLCIILGIAVLLYACVKAGAEADRRMSELTKQSEEQERT